MSISKKIVIFLTTAALLVTMCTPVFAKGPMHNVAFIYGAKQVIVQVEHGKNAEVPKDTYVPGFSFIGWVGNATNVTEDRVILGGYMPAGYTNFQTTDSLPVPVISTPDPAQDPTQSCGNTYRVSFVDGITGDEYYGQTVSEGADANPPEVPHHDGYHFEYYDGSYTGITSDCTITACYEEDEDHWHDTYDKQWWEDHGGDSGRFL